MHTDIPKKKRQLQHWRRTIDRLAAVVHGVGSLHEFDALLYIDELKALHATARSRLDEFDDADCAGRRDLRAGLDIAWADMDEGLENLGWGVGD